jgi:hypothetical protein
MGIVADAEELPKNEEINDLLVVYRAMIDLMRQGNAGIKIDMTRYHKLEAKANSGFSKLSNVDQKIAVDDLVRSGHMDPKLAEILTSFYDSRITKV